VTLGSPPRNRGDIQVATEGKSLKAVTSFGSSSCGSSVAASALTSSFGASGSSSVSTFSSSRGDIQVATEGKSLNAVTSIRSSSCGSSVVASALSSSFAGSGSPRASGFNSFGSSSSLNSSIGGADLSLASGSSSSNSALFGSSGFGGAFGGSSGATSSSFGSSGFATSGGGSGKSSMGSATFCPMFTSAPAMEAEGELHCSTIVFKPLAPRPAVGSTAVSMILGICVALASRVDNNDSLVASMCFFMTSASLLWKERMLAWTLTLPFESSTSTKAGDTRRLIAIASRTWFFNEAATSGEPMTLS